MSSYDVFLRLHKAPEPLLLGNIWDVYSAQLFEAQGYAAIGTSSLAVAKAWGYDDGEKISFDALLQLARRVTTVVRIPFTVDLEGGYSRNVNEILENIQKLCDAGVAGINLEDSVAGQLQSSEAFQRVLSAIADDLSRRNLKVFINARTDGFLFGLPAALTETLARIKAYAHTGIHGVFVPGITATADIEAVVKATDLPINVMCIPGLTDFKTLASLGVKRISMGPFLFNKVYSEMKRLSKLIQDEQRFAPILP